MTGFLFLVDNMIGDFAGISLPQRCIISANFLNVQEKQRQNEY